MKLHKKKIVIKTRQVPNDEANNSFKRRLHNIQDKIDSLANKKSTTRFFDTDGPDSRNNKFMNALVNCIEDGPTTSNAHQNVVASTPHYTKCNELFFNNNISLGMSPIEFQNSKKCSNKTEQSETNESSYKARRKLPKTHLATPHNSASSIIKRSHSKDPVARKNEYIEGGIRSPYNSRVSKIAILLNDKAHQGADAEEELDNFENSKTVSKKIYTTNTKAVNKSKKVETKARLPEQIGTLVKDVDTSEVNAEKSLSDEEGRVSKTLFNSEGRKRRKPQNTETRLETVGHLDQDKTIHTTNTRNINKSKKGATKASLPEQNEASMKDDDILEVNTEKSLSDKESRVSKALFTREDPRRRQLQNTETRLESVGHLDQDKTIHTTNTRNINKSKKGATKASLPEQNEASMKDDDILEVNTEKSLSDKESRVSKALFTREDPRRRQLQNTETRLESVGHLDQDKTIHTTNTRNINKSKKGATKASLPEQNEASMKDDDILEVNTEKSLSDKESRVSKALFTREDPRRRQLQNTETRLESVGHLEQDKSIQHSRANNDNSLLSIERDETVNDPSSLDVILKEIKEKVRRKAGQIVNVQEERRGTTVTDAACSSLKPVDTVVRKLRQRIVNKVKGNANELSLIEAVDPETDPSTRSERIIKKLIEHIAASKIAKRPTKTLTLSDCDTSDADSSVARKRRRRRSKKSVMVQTSALHIQLDEEYHLERRPQRNTIAEDDDMETESELSTCDDNSEVQSNTSRSSAISYSNNRGFSKIVNHLQIEPANVKIKSYRSRRLRQRLLRPLPVFATESLHTVEQVKVGKDATTNICQTATTECNRISNTDAPLFRRSSIRKGKRPSRQLHVTVNSPNDTIRPNIFDSLKEEGSLDFAFEEYSDMYYSDNENAPWRFSGRCSQIPIQDGTNLNFLRSAAEISYLQANNSQKDADCDTSAEHNLIATTELPSERILRSYANRTRNIPNAVCVQSKATSPSKRVSESSENREEAILSSSESSDLQIDSFKTTEENIAVDKSKMHCDVNSQRTGTNYLADNVSEQKSVSSTVHILNKPDQIVNKSLSITQLTNSDATLDTFEHQTSNITNRRQSRHAQELIIQNAGCAEVTREHILSDPETESHIQSDNEYVSSCPHSFNKQNSEQTLTFEMANTESVGVPSDTEDQTSNRPTRASRKSRNVRSFEGDVSVKNILPGRARRTRVPVLKLPDELLAEGYTLVKSPNVHRRKTRSKKVSFMRKSKSIINGRTADKIGKNRIDEKELETQALESIREISVQENEENNLDPTISSDVPTNNAETSVNYSSIRVTDSELMPPPKTTTMFKRHDSCNRNSEFESIHSPGHLRVGLERDIENNDKDDRAVSLSSNTFSQTTENTTSRASEYEADNENLHRRLNGQGDSSSTSFFNPLSFKQLDDGCFNCAISVGDDLLLNVGYIKILPHYCKPTAISYVHSTFYFVVSGCGQIHIENKKKAIEQSDRFAVAKGVSYLIKNTSSTETLLLHYTLSKSDDHNRQ